jgi:predicted transcriptional regulator
MIQLKDLPEKEVYLRFNEDFKKEFFEVFEDNFDISILKKLGYKSVIEQWRAYKQPRSFYPLFLIKKICQMLENIDSKFSMNEIDKNIEAIKAGRFGHAAYRGMIRKPKLPLVFNLSIARLIAHCLGDGDIHPSGRIRYTNSNRNLIDSFISDLNSLGRVAINERYDDYIYRVYVPKIVKLVLDEFGLKDKTYKIILKAKKELQAVFIQALFDDEGCVNLSSPRIIISSSNKPLLEVIKLSLMNSFQIVSKIYFKGYFQDRKGNKRTMWVIDITGFKNFEKFYKLIKSRHSEKIVKLEKLLKLYEGKKIRPLRYETSNRILELLKKDSMTKQQIASKLGLSINVVTSQIRKLRLVGKVFRVGRIKISRQCAMLWSLENKSVKWVVKNEYGKFSKSLLEELNKPKSTSQLSKKFNRCKGTIQYFLRKMEKDNLVRRIKHKTHFWLRR